MTYEDLMSTTPPCVCGSTKPREAVQDYDRHEHGRCPECGRTEPIHQEETMNEHQSGPGMASALTREAGGIQLVVEPTLSGAPVEVGDYTIHAIVNVYGPDEANEIGRFVQWRGGPILAQMTGLASPDDLHAVADLLAEYLMGGGLPTVEAPPSPQE